MKVSTLVKKMLSVTVLVSLIMVISNVALAQIYQDSKGNVGIGTKIPRAELDLVGPGYPSSFMFLDATGGNEDAGFRLYRKGAVKWHIFNSKSGDDAFYIDPEGAASGITVKKDGNVGIGTTSPKRQLHLYSPSVSSELIMENGEGLADYRKWNLYVDGGAGKPQEFCIRQLNESLTGGPIQFCINGSGNVGIGTQSPSEKLHIAGAALATQWKTSSDSRLKQDITPIDNALEKVSALRGVTFKWRTKEFPDRGLAEGTKVGLIAQEVEKVLPELVSTDHEGYKSVEYANMVAVLIEAIKEQQAQIKAQQTQIAELQSRIKAIESK